MANPRMVWPLVFVSLPFLVGCDDGAPPALVAAALTPQPVLPIGGGNALTLPAQRHLVRIGDTLLLALQQDGASGHWLRMFRSDDEGQSWRSLGALEDTGVDRDTADLVAVGQDVALVTSYEGPTLAGSAAHDVVFQWWRRRSSGEWTPDPPVRVFDSTSSQTGYYRAELALDSLGRLWVQAFLLEPDGSSSARVAVSTNGGASFVAQPLLASLPYRGGGRLASVGGKLLFVYDGHDNGTHAARFRLRDDSAPLAEWRPDTLAFSEGIYHGAACSSVGDGAGGLHLVYKDKNGWLWLRRFDGSAFGSRQLIDDSGGWELQGATTRLGSDLVIYYNRVITSGYYDELRVRLWHGGVLGASQLLDGSPSFKGYPAAAETLSTGVAQVPALLGVTPDANSGGQATLYAIQWAGTPPPPPSDMARPPDGPGDGGSGAVLFADSFNRQILPDRGLGSDWTVTGAWFADGRAISDLDSGNRALANPVRCADCTAAVSVISFGVPEVGLVLRQDAAGNRYELVLTANGTLRLRRVRDGVTTILAQGVSGAGPANTSVRLELTATGAGPVSLVARVDGVTRLSASDTTPLGSAGAAGLWSSSAGVPFDEFVLTSR